MAASHAASSGYGDQSAILRRNHVSRMGGAGDETLLFAHGLGCDQTVWRGVAERLAPRYRMAAFDYVGSGASDASAYDPERYGSLDGYVRDLIEVTEALAVARPTLVAHSVSCCIGISAAVRRPELFGKLVLVAPNPRFLNEAPDYVGGFEPKDVAGFLDLMDRNFMGWADSFASVVAREPDVVRAMHDSFTATDRRVVRTFAEVTFGVDVRALLPQLRVPSLILQCSEDAVAPRHIGAWMQARMPGAQLRQLEVVGHCPHLSHPALVAEAVRAFVEGS